MLTLDSISNHDITKWDFILNMDLIEFMNILSFYKQKENLEKRILERYKKA